MIQRIMLMLIAGMAAFTIQAEDAWLSTPESIAAFRQQVEAMRPSPSQFELASIEDRTITLGDRDIQIRIYDPVAATPPSLLIYVHGACWVAGSLDSHDEISRYLALKGNTKVIAIDYRLAPEHKFPAAHDDVYDSIRWVWDHAPELGVDRSRIALGGESAGAHLAAAAALRLADEPDAPELAFLLLVYAALDGGGSSWPECKDQYFESKDDARSRLGSPLWAEDLSRMPRTFSIYGEYEAPRAEQELFVRKLREDGVSVDSFMNPSVGHDVGTWLKVSGKLAAHEAAIAYIHQGFERAR
ncbi:MAG: alpha/beta hydrolase [Lysobacterales bacterium]